MPPNTKTNTSDIQHPALTWHTDGSYVRCSPSQNTYFCLQVSHRRASEMLATLPCPPLHDVMAEPQHQKETAEELRMRVLPHLQKLLFSHQWSNQKATSYPQCICKNRLPPILWSLWPSQMEFGCMHWIQRCQYSSLSIFGVVTVKAPSWQKTWRRDFTAFPCVKIALLSIMPGHCLHLFKKSLANRIPRS